jgi:hypothetical protein
VGVRGRGENEWVGAFLMVGLADNYEDNLRIRCKPLLLLIAGSDLRKMRRKLTPVSARGAVPAHPGGQCSTKIILELIHYSGESRARVGTRMRVWWSVLDSTTHQ